MLLLVACVLCLKWRKKSSVAREAEVAGSKTASQVSTGGSANIHAEVRTTAPLHGALDLASLLIGAGVCQGYSKLICKVIYSGMERPMR